MSQPRIGIRPGLDRVFLAIPVPAPVRAAVAAVQSRLSATGLRLRWANPETLHLTLHFFGAITEENLEKIEASMLSVGLEFAPFDVTVAGLGAFPNLRRPRVLWLGLNPAEPLQALYRNWRRELGRLGLQLDGKPFSPHLTIGRFRQRASSVTQAVTHGGEDSPVAELTVDRLVLYSSTLTPQGAEHTPLHTVALGNDTQPA